jgi:hypothetical protein
MQNVFQLRISLHLGECAYLVPYNADRNAAERILPDASGTHEVVGMPRLRLQMVPNERNAPSANARLGASSMLSG